MPNSRQWAFIFWSAIALIVVLSQRELRLSVLDLLRVVWSTILGRVLVFLAWTVGLVCLASRVQLWDLDRATDTVFWFVTAGLVLFGNLDKVSKERHFLRRKAFSTFGLSSIVEVLSEVFVLNLVAEVVFLPFLAALGAMSVYSAHRLEHRQVKKMVDSVIWIWSVGLMVYIVVSFVNNWNTLDKIDLFQQVALPTWLTVGALPYIFFVALISAYAVAFNRIDRWSDAAGGRG